MGVALLVGSFDHDLDFICVASLDSLMRVQCAWEMRTRVLSELVDCLG